jgi:hypothetical protein
MATEQEKWEYCILEGMVGPGFAKFAGPRLIFITPQGEKIETFGKDVPSLSKARLRIAQLGEEGWEMVGMGNIGEVAHAIYFKRRI